LKKRKSKGRLGGKSLKVLRCGHFWHRRFYQGDMGYKNEDWFSIFAPLKLLLFVENFKNFVPNILWNCSIVRFVKNVESIFVEII